MKKIVFLLVATVLITSCNLNGVENESATPSELDSLLFGDGVETTNKDSLVKPNNKLDTAAVDVLNYDNGIRIKWFERGEGELIKKNDLIAIDYRNQLEDGTVYDGNHLVKKAHIPFFVGWNQQTKGWDFALTKLRVGDEVEIFIPSDFARGAKGIPGVVPPNANNVLFLMVVKKIEPDYIEDGIRTWIVEKTKENRTAIAHDSNVSIHYWVSAESKPRYDNSYKRKLPFDLKMGDGNIVPGLYKSLLRGKKGDKMMIHIPALEAYGPDGLPGLVPRNEDIFYDLIVLDVN